MIRDIIKTDKEQVLELAELFYHERLERAGVMFDYNNAAVHFDLLIKTPGLLALCAEENGEIVGMIAGTASAIIFAKELAMQEMVWYVKPECRKSGLNLLKEFEKRARAMGYERVMMVGMAGDPVLDIYPRFGYVETQRVFMKRLD